MKLKPNTEALRVALTMLPFGVAAALLLALSTSSLAPSEISLAALILVSILQVGLIYTFVLAYFGWGFAQRVGLDRKFDCNWKMLGTTCLIGLACSLILASDYVLFAPSIPALKASYVKEAYTSLSLLMKITYGGVVEEVMMRLFLLSLILVLFKGNDKGWKPVVANLIVSVLFALGHLPATNATFGGLTFLLVLRSLVLNGILGYIFGVLYLKRGLVHSISAHALTHIGAHVILRCFIL